MKQKQGFLRFLPVLIFIAAILARLIPGTRTIDDAYITFRYARNILAGNGFVYNPGERLLGTTTPLYTILLAACGIALNGAQTNFPQVALVINALADALACLLLYKLGKTLSHPITGIASALIWAIAPYSVTFAIGGLETSLYVLLILASLYSHITQKHVYSALFSALAFLLRPDALIFISLIVLDRLIYTIWQYRQNHKVSFKSLLFEASIFLLPTLTWLIFAWTYFGNILPHSMLAKTLAYHIPPHTALIRLLQHYATPFMEDQTFGTRWLYIGIFIIPFLCLVGALQSYKLNHRTLPWILYPWFYFLIFAFANPLIFRWYLTPPLPIYIFTILLGAESIVTNFLFSLRSKITNQGSKPLFNNRISSSLIILIIAAVPLCLSLNAWTLHPDHGVDRPAPKMAWYQLELLYNQAAKRLEPMIKELGNKRILAAGDVGVLGYETGLPILDTVGLNSAVSTSYYPLDSTYYAINYAIPPDLIMDNLPDFIVILEVYGRNGLLKDARFIRQYTLLDTIPTQIYGSEGMLIYVRQDLIK
jgi:hypothetical protein